VKPWLTIKDKWNISEKEGRENYFEKVFSLWKKPYLPAKLQNFCLLHVNNRYNYNTQLSKYKKDEQGEKISDKCTFCSILDPQTVIRESKEHIYTGCPSSLRVLTRVAERYSITLPNTQENGELILYYYPMPERWDAERVNLFLIIYRFYIFKSRLRITIPTEEGFERDLKTEVKNIILTNPGNKKLRENLLPLWICNELSIDEAIEILNTADGKIENATILNDANKICTFFNKPVINGFGFPIVTEHAISLREYETQFYEKFTCFLFQNARS